MARRAGRLLAGTETVLAALKKGRVCLILLAEDLSPKTRERLSRTAGFYGVTTLIRGRTAELARATGCPGRGVYGVTAPELAAEIISSLTMLSAAEMGEGGGKDSEQNPCP